MSTGIACQHGLTLIEMVVVLAILAVLAGVAVRSLEPIADQARYEATQKTMESVKNAIIEDRLQTSGARQITGFVADIGQLPTSTWMLIDSTGDTPFFVGNGSSSTAGTTSLVSDSGDTTNRPRQIHHRKRDADKLQTGLAAKTVNFSWRCISRPVS